MADSLISVLTADVGEMKWGALELKRLFNIYIYIHICIFVTDLFLSLWGC